MYGRGAGSAPTQWSHDEKNDAGKRVSNAIEEPTAPRDRRAADRLLLRGAWQSGPWLVPLILTALVLAAASIALPAVLGRAADAVIGRASTSWLTWAAVVVGVLVACDA